MTAGSGDERGGDGDEDPGLGEARGEDPRHLIGAAHNKADRKLKSAGA